MPLAPWASPRATSASTAGVDPAAAAAAPLIIAATAAVGPRGGVGAAVGSSDSSGGGGSGGGGGGGGRGGGCSSSSGSGRSGGAGGAPPPPAPHLGIVRPPDDLVGRVYTTRRPEWMGDLARTADAATFRRAGLARKHGLDVAVGVPVVVGGVVLGVLVLLDTEWRRYEPALTALAADVGALVAAVWIRDRAGRPGADDGGGAGRGVGRGGGTGAVPDVPPALIGGLAEAAVASAAALLA